MPDIDGTNGNDDIDVTDDSGTLNDVSQGNPIDSIEARQGDDTISISDSTISDRVRGNGGDDEITVSGSTLLGNLAGNGGADTISVTDSTISARLNGGGGDDVVSVSKTDVDRINLGNNNDSLNFVDSSSAEGVFGGGGTDALNLPVGTIVNDAGGSFTVELGVAYTLTNGTFQLPSGQVVPYSQFENGSGIACFTSGTLIATESGARAIEDLMLEDRVLTMDCGLQPVRWIGKRRLAQSELGQRPELRPIIIRKGALGHNHPADDLMVSPQHRILLRSRVAKRMFGHTEILVPAIKLLDLDGVDRALECESVTYFHLMLDSHQVIFANGQPTESLYAGPEAMKALQPAAYLELITLFPELRQNDFRPVPARMFVKRNAQIEQLISRHKKNDKSLM